MTQIAIYARYSTDMQSEASIEDQIRLCQERAEKEGWKLHNSYTDHGKSGATLLRPGVQMLLQDAMAGKFEVVIAEALDRLSRDQEDIAGIYKRLTFAGVKILTLAEGEVNDLHIGLKGTMNALFLKDLADKTRRGLRGRVEAGKSGGGNAYGYDVVKRFNDAGEAIRGDRKINEHEAGIVRRIFNDYASGKSPKGIASQLNAEKIASPSGKGWGQSTINGNRERGTGILNNELYVGRLVWNRLRYLKDPDTGKRVSRLNPNTEWIIKDVSDLRIVDQDLWDKVKERQGALKVRDKTGDGMWNRRRPKYLLSGLIKCGHCGGGFAVVSQTHMGCSTARNKGTCDNRRTIKREALEELVLSGLRDHLMDPELCEIFAEEYTRHLNELRIAKNASISAAKTELDRIDREQEKLVDAICDGVPASKVKDRMIALEARQKELEEKLANSKEEPVLIHPNMGKVYRKQVSDLAKALNDEKGRTEAAELLRGLIDRVIVTPDPDTGKPVVDLEGDLAGILTLGQTSKNAVSVSEDDVSQLKLVAGARNNQEPTLTIFI
jgi:site-specific DNA recombinase